MLRKTKFLWRILPLIAVANLCLIAASTVKAQDEDARRLWDGAFLKKRAEAKTRLRLAKQPLIGARLRKKQPHKIRLRRVLALKIRLRKIRPN